MRSRTQDGVRREAGRPQRAHDPRADGVRRREPGGHAYDIDFYDDARGCLIAERWLIHGMGHAWSNAESNGSQRDLLFTDAAGPDVTTPVYDFFLAHPMPHKRYYRTGTC